MIQNKSKLFKDIIIPTSKVKVGESILCFDLKNRKCVYSEVSIKSDNNSPKKSLILKTESSEIEVLPETKILTIYSKSWGRDSYTNLGPKYIKAKNIIKGSSIYIWKNGRVISETLKVKKKNDSSKFTKIDTGLKNFISNGFIIGV